MKKQLIVIITHNISVPEFFRRNLVNPIILVKQVLCKKIVKNSTNITKSLKILVTQFFFYTPRLFALEKRIVKFNEWTI